MATALKKIDFKYDGHPKFFEDLPELVANGINNEKGKIVVQSKKVIEISLL